MRWLIGYGVTALAFLLLDGIWLGSMTPVLYRPALGPLLAPRFQLLPAVAFYLIYTGGLLTLAVSSGGRSASPLQAAAQGAILGLVAYATYDLTNLATLKDYPMRLALIDLSWGTIASALAAYAGSTAMLIFARG